MDSWSDHVLYRVNVKGPEVLHVVVYKATVLFPFYLYQVILILQFVFKEYIFAHFRIFLFLYIVVKLLRRNGGLHQMWEDC